MTAAFQFISAQAPRLTARLVRASIRVDTVVVLDLEDSLWDVADESRTPALKRAGREHLRTLAMEHGELWTEGQVGVRVNRLSSAERNDDLRVLADISQHVMLDCVVPTKVESGADLEHWVHLLRHHNVAYRRLVPIVETVRGVANLDEVAAAAHRLGVEWMVYGYYDHMLDARSWPFAGSEDASFWRLVEPIIGAIERGGLGYVHPPFFRLNDGAGFEALLDRLAAVCANPFGVITLGTRQTAVAAGHMTGLAGRPLSDLRQAGDDTPPRDRARRVVDAFTVKRHPSLSFVIEPRTGEFISPHLYLAARKIP